MGDNPNEKLQKHTSIFLLLETSNFVASRLFSSSEIRNLNLAVCVSALLSCFKHKLDVEDLHLDVGQLMVQYKAEYFMAA